MHSHLSIMNDSGEDVLALLVVLPQHVWNTATALMLQVRCRRKGAHSRSSTCESATGI